MPIDGGTVIAGAAGAAIAHRVIKRGQMKDALSDALAAQEARDRAEQARSPREQIRAEAEARRYDQRVNRAVIKMSPADRREFADRTQHLQRDRGLSR